MKKILFIATLIIFSVSAYAQEVYAKLSYVSKVKEVRVFVDDQNELVDYRIGEQLKPGYRIVTTDATAEIELFPNKSIIKIGKKTTIKISSLIGLGDAKDNSFDLDTGKIRMVAAKQTTPDSYKIKTKTTVAGVRGTDFGIDVGDDGLQKAVLVVREGLVNFTNAAKQALDIGKGMMADGLASNFVANTLSNSELADFFEGFDFTNLNPQKVPGKEPKTTAADGSNGSNNSNPDGTGDSANDKPPVANTPSPLNEILDFLGVEIGSVVIDGSTYGKAVIQPKIITPEFKIGFYLPIIYTDNLFNPSTWYHPNGNDEWSFGTDQNGDVLNIILDVWNDLVLKIKFIDIGNEQTPFNLAFGSLSDMTLGHGSLINGYANDADFPAVRRSGFKIGINTEGFGLHLLTGDLGQPELFGVRFVLKPAPGTQAGIGISAALDINPKGSIETGTSSTSLQLVNAVDPLILGFGLDFELPFEILGAKFMPYADIATLLPIARNTSNGISAGAHFESVLDLTALRNYGWYVGIKGSIPIIVSTFDWKVEFQYENGAFGIGYFDKTYDRTRGEKASRLLSSIVNMDTNGFFTAPTLGVKGEGGAEIFGILRLAAGYTWPWMVKDGELLPGESDDFSLSLGFLKDKLPFGIRFKIEYLRTHFRELFFDSTNYTLFDQYTLLRGGLTVPVGDFFKIKASVGTTSKRDSTGAIVLDAQGKPKLYPTFSIMTLIGDNED